MNLMPSKEMMKEIFKQSATILLLGLALSALAHLVEPVRSNMLLVALLAGRYAFDSIYKQVSKLKGL